eukprot:TRINITY_DN21877_c0_g1_i1.p1 TRINITY_DN21877_c0_g1~~TRINITY_DN21877_c0_g1_i1.p1  ORF type:complete len:425 (-),score=62.30 TRINITY_DN21877_c0_g1_i1:84-1304(-)
MGAAYLNSLVPDAGQRLCTDYTGDIYDPGSFFSLIECRDDRCCDPFGECQDFTCGDGLMDKAGKSSIVCSTATCDELECCDIDPCADGYAFLEGGRTGTWCICKPGYIINDRGDGVDNGNRYPLANVGVAGYFCLATTTTTTFTSTTSTTSSTLPVVHCPPGYREKPATSYFRRTCKIPTLCDPEGDLETFCDQLCESFDCTGYSRTKENASDIVCIGRCDPFIDRRTCCEYFPAVDEGAKLLTAAMTKEAHQVDRLVAMGVDTSSSSGDGSTALHFAGLHDNSESVKRLLEGRADPNALDVRGWSPLHVAAGRGHVSSVNLLVDYRAIPDLKSHDGMTAREVALRVAGPSHGPRRPQAEVAVILARAERAWKDELAWAASLPMEAVPPNHARHYEKEHRKARMEL